MRNNPVIGKYLFLLIVLSTIIRAYIAATIELGNDEVYYRLYALYPDWSHFDHPFMVGAFIQFFSLDLLFDHAFFIRLSSVVFGGVNTWLIYLIGKELKNQWTGFYAALLYTASVYSFIITGIFILPDTPQSFFWLLSIFLMLRIIATEGSAGHNARLFLLLGLSLGLGMLSKYTTVFLWFGFMAYLLLYHRHWLKKPSLYLALLISAVCVLPILIWNIQNHFISFSFHSSRVDMSGYSLRPDTFFTELAGEFVYNNPVNFILIVMALVAAFRGRLDGKKSSVRLLLWLGLPLIVVFLVFSMFRSTLPHWTAPAYSGLIPLAALFIFQQQKKPNKPLFPKPILGALALLIVTLLLGVAQIKYGLIPMNRSEVPTQLGKNDPSLDMYGYHQMAKSFGGLVDRDRREGRMSSSPIVVGDNWFPLANLDYYVAGPLGLKCYGIGDLDRIHKYAWINKIQGGLSLGMDAYYITTSRAYRAPQENLSDYFEATEAADTIRIFRDGIIVKNAFVFRLKNLQRIPADPLQ